jgi:hypothetical protein
MHSLAQALIHCSQLCKHVAAGNRSEEALRPAAAPRSSTSTSSSLFAEAASEGCCEPVTQQQPRRGQGRSLKRVSWSLQEDRQPHRQQAWAYKLGLRAVQRAPAAPSTPPGLSRPCSTARVFSISPAAASKPSSRCRLHSR